MRGAYIRSIVGEDFEVAECITEKKITVGGGRKTRRQTTWILVLTKHFQIVK